jgi:hypothetical protein
MNGGGYFWFVRSINNCEIEENVVVGQPDIENITYPDVISKYGWGLPPPSIPESNFLNPLDIDKFRFGTKESKLEIQKPLNGGGAYVNLNKNEWQIKSMTPPSPYVLFWPTDRPLYLVGKLENDIGPSVNDRKIIINDDTKKGIDIIRKVQKNPILLLNGDEQAQLITMSGNELTVNRAVNYNGLLEHKKGTEIYIFPYQELSTNYLNSHFKLG